MPSDSSDLKARTLSGVRWTSTAQTLRHVQSFFVIALLSRFVSPDEFGLIAMVFVFTSLVHVLNDVGLSSAIVSHREIRPPQLTSIFWINVLLSLLLTAGLAASAPLIASFYMEPSLAPLTLVLASTFVINATGMVHRALLTKNMEFSRLAYVDIAAMVVADVVACAMAIAGFGVWSLVAQSVTNIAVGAVGVWIASSWRPGFSLGLTGLRPLLSYGVNLTSFSVLSHVMRNLDKVLIGKLAGASALGFYGRAYSLMLLPNSLIARVLGQVMFPALSEIRNDRDRTRRAYLAVTRAIAFVAFPTFVGLFVVAEPFVAVVYGHEWDAVVPILRVLCIIGLSQSIGVTLGWIYMSQGRTDLQLRWGIFASIVTASAFVIGIRWGALGVAWSYVIVGYTILWYPGWRIAFTLIDLDFIEVVRNIIGALAVALLMGAIVWTIDVAGTDEWRSWAQLSVQVPTGVVVYLALSRLFRIAELKELMDIARGQVRELLDGQKREA